MWRAGTNVDLRVGEWREDYYQRVELWGVVVTHTSGARKRYFGPAAPKSKEAAEKLANRVNTWIDNHPDWEPRDKYWCPIYPVYGSEEYQRSGEEEEWAHQEREASRLGYDCDPRLPYLG